MAHAGDFDKLLERAGSGDPGAQLEAAEKYASGDGVAKDNAKAIEWLEAAANQGIAEAQTKLGAMYLGGRGVPRADVSVVAPPAGRRPDRGSAG